MRTVETIVYICNKSAWYMSDITYESILHSVQLQFDRLDSIFNFSKSTSWHPHRIVIHGHTRQSKDTWFCIQAFVDWRLGLQIAVTKHQGCHCIAIVTTRRMICLLVRNPFQAKFAPCLMTDIWVNVSGIRSGTPVHAVQCSTRFWQAPIQQKPRRRIFKILVPFAKLFHVSIGQQVLKEPNHGQGLVTVLEQKEEPIGRRIGGESHHFEQQIGCTTIVIK